MDEVETAWRALADALTHAMTEAGAPPDRDFILGVAQGADDWLRIHGFAIERYIH